MNPKKTIGTVNIAEFFITFFTSGVFLVFVGIHSWKPIIGLIIGGIMAAPFAAWIVRIARHQYLTILVGILICLLSIYNIYQSWDFIIRMGNSISMLVR